MIESWEYKEIARNLGLDMREERVTILADCWK